MIVDQIQISNFRSFDDCTVDLGSIQAIVGRNNVGKSNLLKAIRLFMEASKRLLDEDCFHHHNTDEPIRIRVRFVDLNEWERQKFKGWLYDEDTLIVERKFEKTEDDDYKPTQVAAIVREPEPDWLKESVISGRNIKEWWKRKDELTVDGRDFGTTLGTSRPNVGQWKDAAADFVEKHQTAIDFEKTRSSITKSVLNEALPEFILVPAVREVTEASKITKTSPFGQLINSVISRVAESRRQEAEEAVANVESLLNRGEDRLPAIDEFEDDLNESIQEVHDVDLEITMDVPDLDDLLKTAEVYARDGTRTPIQSKGHGLQRSTIFTILRVYSEFTTQEEEASKSTIFAFEEPEIYQHPQSQRTLHSVFRDIVDSGDQILYTTHSSHFVKVSRFDEVCIMRKEGTAEDFRTEPTQLGMEQMRDDLKARKGTRGTPEGMRNQYANAFDARISEGFFADKVILVEGESEKYILPIYARLLGYDFDRNNVAVVYPGTGKGQLDRLIRIFAGFDIPTYPIFDDDGGVGSKTVEIAGLMGRNLSGVDSIETTIGDRLTIFEGELEDALEDEIDEYQEWWDEASKAWGECGKPLKHRYMAVQIENKIKDGTNPEEVIPQTVQQIIRKVRDLDTAVEVFEREVGEEAVVAAEN
jgi:predicted ATP-dependent endonuclease of OLD family